MPMSKEEKKKLYEDYLASGLSIKDYADIHGISSYILRGLISYHKRTERNYNDDFITIVNKDRCPNNHLSFKLDNHLIEIDERYLKLFLGSLS